MIVTHPFKPVYDKFSKVMILGTLPSIKSRAENYPYSHPQNRFWKIMEAIFEDKMTDYKEFFLRHHIAYWDTIKKCEIKGSSDASIKVIEVNPIEKILKDIGIKYVFCTGKKSYEIYMKYIYPKSRVEAIYLSSTSPANAKMSLEELIEEYGIIKKIIASKKS